MREHGPQSTANYSNLGDPVVNQVDLRLTNKYAAKFGMEDNENSIQDLSYRSGSYM